MVDLDWNLGMKTQKLAEQRGSSAWDGWERGVREFGEMTIYENYWWVNAVLVIFFQKFKQVVVKLNAQVVHRANISLG